MAIVRRLISDTYVYSSGSLMASGSIYTSASIYAGGEITVNDGFFGNLTGTASFSLTSSYIKADNIDGVVSRAISSSYSETSSKVGISTASGDSDFSVVFANGVGNQSLYQNSSIRFNPADGRLTVNNITSSLYGTSSWSDSSSISVVSEKVNIGAGSTIDSTSYNLTLVNGTGIKPLTAVNGSITYIPSKRRLTVNNITSSLYGTSSWAVSASVALSASHALYSNSSSYAITSSYSNTSSYSLTASYISGANIILEHNLLQGLQGGSANEYYHLNATDYTDLTDGGFTTLHKHESSSYADTSSVISVTNKGGNDDYNIVLVDGVGNKPLHVHDTQIYYNPITGALHVRSVEANSITSSFLGDLQGTSSWSEYSVSASYAPVQLSVETSSYVINEGVEQKFINYTVSIGATNEAVVRINTSSYSGVLMGYLISGGGGNKRVGNLNAVWSGSNVNHTETTTVDIGTSNLSFNVIINGSFAEIVATNTNDTYSYDVKVTVTSL